jgi:hypothetical protein
MSVRRQIMKTTDAIQRDNSRTSGESGRITQLSLVVLCLITPPATTKAQFQYLTKHETAHHEEFGGRVIEPPAQQQLIVHRGQSGL